MFTTLDVFKTAHAMARHAGQRQALVAENMANSDTPGFRPRDLTPFSEMVRPGATDVSARATRPGHLFGSGPADTLRPTELRGPTGADGNGVSLEQEMLRAVEVKRQHDRAIAIYKSGLTVLRSSLGRNA